MILAEDGRKMSKSYKNIIPLLSTEKALKKIYSKKLSQTSLEPGEPKEYESCTVFSLYKHFSTSEVTRIFEASIQ